MLVLFGAVDVVVIEGAGAADGVLEAVEDDGEVVVVGSLQPNQPGVLQVDVELVEVEVADDFEVVVSSKQPHHPGVLHVSVLVALLELLEVLVLVIGSLLLLS